MRRPGLRRSPYYHYMEEDDNFRRWVESIAPRQVLTVSFVADKAGDFPVYSAIFCTIHIFMEYGELRVLC